MSVEPRVISNTPPVMEVVASGKLETGDYQRIVPYVESLIEQRGSLRILFRAEDFEGWDAGVTWEGVRYDTDRFDNVARLAIVGDKAWHPRMVEFVKPFTNASVRFFSCDQLEEAERWVRGARSRRFDRDAV